MIPGRLPLNVYKGDTFRWRFTLWVDDAHTNPADLSGALAMSQIRDRPGGTLIASLVCAVTLPNVIDAVLSAEDCAKLPSSSVWDLQLTYPTGDVGTILCGPVNATADVTRTTA